MRQLRLFVLLLEPSFTSSVLSLLLSGSYLIIASWSHIANGAVVSGYLKLSATLQTTPGNFTSLLYALVSQHILYYFLVFVVATGVMVAVYISLDSIEQVLSGLFGLLSVLQFTPQHAKRDVIANSVTRIIFRSIALVTWVVYGFLFIQVLLPFAAISFAGNVKTLDSAHIARALALFALLWLCTYMHTIFLRLLVLRPRVFGSSATVAAGLE